MRSLAMLLCVILCLLPVLAMGEDSLKSAGADAAPEATLQPYSLPVPSDYFGAEGRCESASYRYDGSQWEVWFYPQGEGWEDALIRWLDDCEAAGLSWSLEAVPSGEDTVMAYAVYHRSGRALLIPDYYGQILLMKQYALPMEGAIVPVPTPTPEPVGGRHLEYVVDENAPCPYCYGGNGSGLCRICKGLGYVTYYGYRTDCDPKCSACQGTGIYPQLVETWVPD